MAAARLLHPRFSFFRLCCRRSPLSFSPSPLPAASSITPPLRWTRLLILQHCTTGSAASLDDSTTRIPAEALQSHPWPEWDGFLEKIRSKGYFKVASESAEGEGDGGGSRGVSPGSIEMNRVKNACLSFARERFDLFSSLPKEDIQAVVECGCPNLFRKAVNSAKRLRAFLRLDEGDVCSACNLRGSCDKAYVIAKDEEGARTVDIMRILLYYAVDPVILLGGENPPIKAHVQESARKLLSKLIKLSDTAIDPAIPKPVVLSPPKPVSPSRKEPSQKLMVDNRKSANVEMKRGDWLCPNCNFLNFARNLRCLECKEDGPRRVESNNVEMKLGDWTCPRCQFMNFARNRMCFRCQESRPKRELNPGEWECPSCYFLNFRRNTVCRKCNHDRPREESSQFEDHVWRKPEVGSKGGTLKFGDDEDEIADDNDDEILPLQEGGNKFVVSKRATSSERRLTAARKQHYPL